MTFKTLLIITAVIAVPMGILCMLFPSQMLSSYDVTLSPMGLVVYQFWGVTMIGLGMLIWFLRNIEDASKQKAIASSLFVTFLLSSVMAIRGQYAGANQFGWTTVALYVVLALGYGYVLLFRRNDM